MDSKRRIAKLIKSAPPDADARQLHRVYPEFASCEECLGTLYKADGSICECMAKHRLYNRLRDANVGRRYFDVNLEFYRKYLKECDVAMWNGLKSEFHSDSYNINEFIKFIDNYAKSFASRLGDGRGFIICGGTGCGKTGAMCYIIREVLRSSKRFTAYYIDTIELLDTIDIAWNGNADESEMARAKLSRLKKVDLLVFDDIGSEYAKNKEWLYGRFLDIIKRRYRDNLPTLLATNLQPEKLVAGFDEGPIGRLSSVLSEFQVVCMCNTDDVRVTKTKRVSLHNDMKREKR